MLGNEMVHRIYFLHQKILIPINVIIFPFIISDKDRAHELHKYVTLDGISISPDYKFLCNSACNTRLLSIIWLPQVKICLLVEPIKSTEIDALKAVHLQ